MVAVMPEEEACCTENDGVCDDENDVGDSIIVEVFGSVVDTPGIEIHHFAGWAVDGKGKFEGTTT